MPFIPEYGARGTAGGGDGGTGSHRTRRVTERGGSGFGAYQVRLSGGEGGESGWSPESFNNGQRRGAAGGGGGRFGGDLRLASGCPDETWIGLDAEHGFPGDSHANAATRPGEVLPWGGQRSPLLLNGPPLEIDQAIGEPFHLREDRPKLVPSVASGVQC